MDSVGIAVEVGPVAAVTAAAGAEAGVASWPLPFVDGGTVMGGSAAPWNPTWSVSAGR
jgi:hypothetical protein